MTGKLWGVGVGPGDPEQMTLKAVNTIKNSKYIAVPGKDRDKAVSYKIAKGAINELDLKKCICLNMPMTRDKDELKKAHAFAAAEIIRHLENGEDIAFLTLGDPTVYSTFSYIKDIVELNGYTTDIVNGITSFCAASASLNEILSTMSEEIHIIPMPTGIEDKLNLSMQNGFEDKSSLSMQKGIEYKVNLPMSNVLEEKLILPGTKIIMKPSENYEALKKYLTKNSFNAMLVSNAGMENETVYKDVNEFPDEIPYFSIIIVK